MYDFPIFFDNNVLNTRIGLRLARKCERLILLGIKNSLCRVGIMTKET
jgi:hypothetical protein